MSNRATVIADCDLDGTRGHAAGRTHIAAGTGHLSDWMHLVQRT